MAAPTKRPRGRPRKRETELARWIDASGTTRDDVAAELGVARTHLDRLCRAASRPSLSLAADIETLTKGAVPASAWANIRVYRD